MNVSDHWAKNFSRSCEGHIVVGCWTGPCVKYKTCEKFKENSQKSRCPWLVIDKATFWTYFLLQFVAKLRLNVVSNIFCEIIGNAYKMVDSRVLYTLYTKKGSEISIFFYLKRCSSYTFVRINFFVGFVSPLKIRWPAIIGGTKNSPSGLHVPFISNY